MSYEYFITTYSSNNSLLEYNDKIKEHITALIRIYKTNNNTISVHNILIKIVYDILTYGYSPYIFFSEEYILNRLSNIRLDDIINKTLEWFDKFKLCECNIFGICYNILESNYNKNIMFEILKYYILEHGIVPKCNFLLLSYQYYLHEKKVGNVEEIYNYETLLNEIENDPEEFHIKYKHKLPTQNLDKLVPKIMNINIIEKKQPCCGLCHYDIEESQKYYELPCGHLYHENEQQCLESATIIHWLKNNKLCPICKKEVIL